MSQNNKNIKIVGVGRGGSNVVCRLVEDSYLDSEYIILNYLKIAICYVNSNLGLKSLFIDRQAFPGDCAPEEFEKCYCTNGYNVFNHERKKELDYIINTIFNGEFKHLILVSGFGLSRGLSSVATKWLVGLAKNYNIQVTVVCSIPFLFEGERKQEDAIIVAGELIEKGINVEIIYAQDLTNKYQDLNLLNCFERLNECLAERVEVIYDVVERS